MSLIIRKLFLVMLALSTHLIIKAQVHVKGYYRSNGTYVQPHVRSSPDASPYNNYSYSGNTNPYTGKVATGNPDTYLKNYYDRSDANIKDKKFFISDRKNFSPGGYLKYYHSGETFVVYDTFDFFDKYTGYVSISSQKVARIFNKDGILQNTLYDFDATLSTDLPSSATRNVSDNSPKYEKEQIKFDSFLKDLQSTNINVEESKKEYLKDKNGNYTGLYSVLIETNDVVDNYEIYSTLNELSGYITVYSNGERLIYDQFKRLLKHVRPSVKKQIKKKVVK